MKYRSFLISILLSVSFITSSDSSRTGILFNLKNNQKTDLIIDNFSRVRVIINGQWWIIIYLDGIKIDQYLDPDQ